MPFLGCSRGVAAMALVSSVLAACARAPQRGTTVIAHFDKALPGNVEVRENDQWSRVCATPCDARIPVGAKYRVVGDGQEPIEGTMERSSSAQVNVSAASPGAGPVVAQVAGSVLIAAGSLGLIVGLAAKAISESGESSYRRDCTACDAGMLAGGAGAVVGIVLLVAGVSAEKDSLRADPVAVRRTPSESVLQADPMQRTAPKPFTLRFLNIAF